MLRSSISCIALGAAALALGGCEIILGLERSGRTMVTDGSGDGAEADAGAAFPDAGVDSGECTVPSNLGHLGDRTGLTGVLDPTGDGQIVVPVFLGGFDDVLLIALRQGFGAFDVGFDVGFVDLSGVESHPETCGACVGIGGNVDQGSLLPEQMFIATSGVLRLEVIDLPGGEGDPDGGEGRITGDIESVVFDDFECMADQVGFPFRCSTTVDYLFFDATIVSGDALLGLDCKAQAP